MYQNLAILGVFAFLYAAYSNKLERSPINGAVVFTGFGLFLGPMGLSWLDFQVDAEGLRAIAEITLALVLFTDAANANLSVLKHSDLIPQRLLLIGLPLTILLGVGAGGMLFAGMTWLDIAVLAVMLAPTDAALGKAVVADKSVPENIRESLNLESGLNDGICVPILFVLLTLAAGIEVQGGTVALASTLVAKEIGIGLMVGLLIGGVGARMLGFSMQRDWVTETWQQAPVVVLAVASFAGAQQLGGSGFIAAFVGGLLFGYWTRHHKHDLIVSSESTGDVLAMLTWVIFGAAVVGQSVASFEWQILLYATLSLTVVRMVPVFLSLTGTGLSTAEKLFVGWFGPRGLASIVFGVIVLNEHLPGADIITSTVVCTVALSVLLHGLSANPLISMMTSKRR